MHHVETLLYFSNFYLVKYTLFLEKNGVDNVNYKYHALYYVRFLIHEYKKVHKNIHILKLTIKNGV